MPGGRGQRLRSDTLAALPPPKWTANAIVDYRFDAASGVPPHFVGRYAYRSSMFATVGDGPYGGTPGRGLASVHVEAYGSASSCFASTRGRALSVHDIAHRVFSFTRIITYLRTGPLWRRLSQAP